MTRKNVALLCGQVRDLDAYTRILDILLDWREAGIIDSIVISTWFDELAHHGIRGRCIDQGIEIVEVSPPEVGHRGSAWHQMKNLAFGLEVCEPGSAVFKLRGDKITLTKEIKDVLARRDLAPIDPPPGWPRTFDARVMTSGGVLTQPFFLNDMLFYGLQQDLCKMISFDMSMTMSGALMNVEQLFYSAPFQNDFPIFRQFFRVNWGLLHFAHQRESAKALLRYSLDYRFYREAMLTWFIIVKSYFSIGFSAPHVLQSDAFRDWTLERLFDIDDTADRLGVHFTSNINTFGFNDRTVIDAVLGDHLTPSELSPAFRASHADALDYARQRNFRHLYLGLDDEAFAWAEFVRKHPVGDMKIDHFSRSRDGTWLVQTSPLQLRAG